ncbi:MAG: SBBP repeat-containing protein, partial [Chloroflexota bacterium]|nr:SBBP repeat-containing protein [Chloroflexota bacterium]
STSSADFPTTTSYRATDNSSAVFVAALNTAASGQSSLRYSTLLGGNGFDTGAGIAVTGAGNAYVTGSTTSSNFPFTSGAYATSNHGGSDAFVTELGATGVISYSTYLGGGGDDHGQAIAVTNAGDAYVTGSTGSSDFPQVNPLSAPGSGCGGAGGGSGGVNAFVTEVNPSGSALVYSTYLGGNGIDAGYGIAVTRAGDAYVTGSTTSTNFPTTTGAYTTTNSGGADAFVSKLGAAGNGLLYSTYLGGGSDDTGYGIAANSTGAYVTGQTYSSNFPTTTGAADGANSGSSSAFVARITGTMGETGGGAGVSTSTPVPTCTPLPPTGTATPPPPTAMPVPASLQAYYTFDNTPNDSSGNGHTGALKGAATYVSPGKVGAAALGVDGSAGTFFDVPGQVLDTRQSYSVAAWVNLNAIGDNFQTFACIEGANVCTFFLQIIGDPNIGHKFAFATQNGDSTSAGGVRAYSTILPNTNTWYHLTGVYDAAAGQIRLYVNGQLQGTSPFSSPFQGTKDTVIGRGEFGGPGDYVNGKIDDVHFYQGVLTDAQIAALAGVPAPTATNTSIPTATPTATETSGPVSTPATPGTVMGALQGSQDAAPASANLTTEGATDWIEWGDQPAGNTNNDYTGDYNRKANVAPLISTFNPVGYGTESLSSGGGTVLTWSDGTPTQSGTNNGLGVFVSGNGNSPPSSGSGFQFKVSADTSTRELRVYVNASKARGRLTATLSDNSGPVYSDDSLSNTSGTTAGVYTLYYRAASPGQTLTVHWETAVDYGGGVTLE